MDKQNKFQPLDDEEKELMASIESDTWEPVSNFDEEKQKAIEAARRTLEKDKHINLRLSEKDYHQIQIRAMQEGVSYQTLISSIVHKFLNGTLVPEK